MADIQQSIAPRLWVRYGIAVAAVAGGFLLRLLLTAFVGETLPTYITFYPAVMMAALFSGRGPGILATALVVAGVDYWIVSPRTLFLQGDPAEIAGVVLFSVMGVFISGFTEHYRHARDKALLYDKDLALRESQQALQRTERLYRAIGESIKYGIWICESDGRNTYFSESFLKLVGLTQEQCSNFGWVEALHPEEAERTITAWKECVRSGSLWDVEQRFRGVDGQYHAVLARGVPVRDDRGEILCWAGINLDISRLKHTEEALRQAKDQSELQVEARTAELRQSMELVVAERQRFHDVLDKLPAYLVLLSPDHRVQFENRFFRERFGPGRGRRCYECLVDRSELCENCEGFKALQTQAPHQWEWGGPDGRHYEIHAFPFTDVDGSPLLLEVGLDISGRKGAELERETLRDELARMSRITTAGQLAASLAHG